MATKKKRGTKAAKAKVGGGQSAAGGESGAPAKPQRPRLDVLALGEELGDVVQAFGADDSAVEKLETRVKELRRELAEAEAELELRLRPLRTIERLALEAHRVDPLDLELAKAVSVVELVTYEWVRGGRLPKATGAKPWAQLAEQGATDAAIEQNLQHVQNEHGAAFEIERRYVGNGSSNKHAYELRRRKGKAWEYETLLRGDALLAAVRRVMGIPLPAKSAPAAKPAADKPKAPARKKRTARKKPAAAAAKSPAAKKPAHKPAAKPVAKRPAPKRKSPAAPKAANQTTKRAPAKRGTRGPTAKAEGPAAGGRKYKSGHQKRMEKAEREAKQLAAPKPDEAEPDVPWYAAQPGEVHGAHVARLLPRIDELVADESVDLAWMPVSIQHTIRGRRKGAAPTKPTPAIAFNGNIEGDVPSEWSEAFWQNVYKLATLPELDVPSDLPPVVIDAIAEQRAQWIAAGSPKVWPPRAPKKTAPDVVNTDEVPPAIAAKRSKGSAYTNGRALAGAH